MTLGVSLAGCGGPQSDKELVQVSGTVTYAGEPLPDAIVAFDSAEHADASPSTGVTDDEGHYSLKLSADEVGVPPGRYKVAITAWDAPLEMPKPGAPVVPPRPLIPEKYFDPETSGLTATVESGAPQTIDFDLEKE
jgi:hypothetical protein